MPAAAKRCSQTADPEPDAACLPLSWSSLEASSQETPGSCPPSHERCYDPPPSTGPQVFAANSAPTSGGSSGLLLFPGSPELQAPPLWKDLFLKERSSRSWNSYSFLRSSGELLLHLLAPSADGLRVHPRDEREYLVAPFSQMQRLQSYIPPPLLLVQSRQEQVHLPMSHLVRVESRIQADRTTALVDRQCRHGYSLQRLRPR